jgi:Na+/proline symporter
MQKILSTKTPKDAALMSGFVSVVLMPARYFMIAGFGVLAILYYDKLNLITAGVIDFEQILPSAINQFVPIGLMGFLIAGLLAAFMSTFAGTLNAAQAYIINDIYVKYFKSSDRSTGFVNIFTGLVVVIVSIILGFFAQNVNSILQWIVSALYGGYIAANVLKWYWWRFNGHGYFWGMLAGIIPALIFPKLLPPLFPEIAPDIIFLYFFPVMLAISFMGCIIGTYLKPATDMNTLVEFYNNVRPWGFWRPVHEAAIKKYPGLKSNKNFGRDMFNVFIGTVWQTALMSFPIFIVIRQYNYFLLSIAIAIVTSIILKFNWYDKLED